MLRAAGTLVTFGDFEFVVLLVPQAAPVAGGNLDRKLRVWAVRRRQGEIRGWEIERNVSKFCRLRAHKSFVTSANPVCDKSPI